MNKFSTHWSLFHPSVCPKTEPYIDSLSKWHVIQKKIAHILEKHETWYVVSLYHGMKESIELGEIPVKMAAMAAIFKMAATI